MFICADREYCIRIFQNLIQNCIKHASGDIKINILQRDNHVNLIVKNPLPEDANICVERIFDRFYTADTSRKKVSGLGLSIVALLAEKMQGKAIAFMNNGELSICVELVVWLNK